ncbi:hypothetical protein OOZ15_18450 [Galbibacter sp. EGI 63066]|uniref:DUF7793 family protein n=1 Tax=Galbibacter sp. EGI 63066 TaxID=2993559 RepID=UPI0022496ED9|nr:hypothetical protein [Galbibacter sp. EGI 63066]MCX2681938.1 hypothetical protein [Galbibacter sp. EGI 63066]
MKKCIENSCAYISLEGGILFFKYKDQVTIGLKQAIEVVAARMKLQRGIAYPILCDINGIMEVDRDARKYLAIEGALLSKAIALITDNPVSERISNMYVKNYIPNVPVKICKDQEEGLKFLSFYK